jgi:hypothetical protein
MRQDHIALPHSARSPSTWIQTAPQATTPHGVAAERDDLECDAAIPAELIDQSDLQDNVTFLDANGA